MRYHSNGKLLLTGEYMVLEGATALALPTRPGQSLEVTPTSNAGIRWSSLDHEANPWLISNFHLNNGALESATRDTIGKKPEQSVSQLVPEHNINQRLEKLLRHAHKRNPSILAAGQGYDITTKLDFDRSWGLGSSSTLVNNIAQWFEIDPYDLLENSFGGSGYDIASAQHPQPITYSIGPNGRSILSVPFNPLFKDLLFFVHLNRKQDTRKAVAHFRRQPESALSLAVKKIDGLTHQMIQCKTLQEFELLIDIHETLISGILNLPKVKLQHFPDFPGAVKSLGGWGGDFVLATGSKKQMDYFRSKGYETILSYEELIL